MPVSLVHPPSTLRSIFVFVFVLSATSMLPVPSSSGAFAASATSSSPYDPHWALYPKTYVVKKCPQPDFVDQIDGNLDKAAWKNAPWSDSFGDIQGADAPPGADKPALTKFKAMYDTRYLYIGALLEASTHFNTQAHFTGRNEPIFQKDSDFEVFVDLFGSNHNYKELEVNAINTIWNLMLNKPYADNGTEHSGRISKPGSSRYYDVQNQKTATRVIKGQINDPTGVGCTWTVEVALSFDDLIVSSVDGDDYTDGRFANPSSIWPRQPPPFIVAPGTRIRINFSRVELQGKINWTWQKQRIWDPSTRKHVGVVDMHQPNAWGYFVFAGDDSEDDRGGSATKDGAGDAIETSALSVRVDLYWPARLAAMNVYYAMHAYHNNQSKYTDDLNDLNVDQSITDPFEIEIKLTTRTMAKSDSAGRDYDETTGDCGAAVDGFLVTVRGRNLNGDGGKPYVVTVRDDRLLIIHSDSATSAM